MGKPTAASAPQMGAKRPPPRPSLAATHPSNYVQATANRSMPPPASKVRKTESASTDVKATQKTTNGYPTPSPSPSPPTWTEELPTSTSFNDQSHVRQAKQTTGSSPTFQKRALTKAANPRKSKSKPEMPWEAHTDPTLTASDVPPYWYRNHTVLKADTDSTHGNVISPTFMHGLPFGTMTEAAYHYPSEERLGRLG